MTNPYDGPLAKARAAVQAARGDVQQVGPATLVGPVAAPVVNAFTVGDVHPADAHMVRRAGETPLQYSERVYPRQEIKPLSPLRAARLRAAMAECDAIYKMWLRYRNDG